MHRLLIKTINNHYFGLFMAFLIMNLIFVGSSDVFAETRVILGLERLVDEKIDLIKNKRIGIIANHTSVDSEGRSIVTVLSQHAKITALFGPEHGFTGDNSAGASIEQTDIKGIPIYSLYGNTRVPTHEMLSNVDVLIYDMQDVGVKFYTYISTMFLALGAAEREGIPIIVLDRPNPIGAVRVEGAITNPAYTSFVGVMPLPIRYGMTVGELAKLMNQESYAGFSLNADLTVIPMKNYSRAMNYDQTGLPWIAPSPNMPSLDTAAIYPGFCLFEGTNLSEGRGTDDPFLIVGAPFINGRKWLAAVPEELLTGLTTEVIKFTPKSIPGKSENPKYKGKACHGLHFTITDQDKIKPIELSVALLCAAHSLYPEQYKSLRFMDRLWGDESLRTLIGEGKDFQFIMKTTNKGVKQFLSVRDKYLLY